MPSQLKLLIGFFLFFFIVAPCAYAMHISEGMLDIKWSLIWWLTSIPFIIAGLFHIQKLKRINPLYLPLVSAIAAVIFIFSMLPLPVPITGTTSHPIATGLSALLLGALSTVVISFISLLIQAIFLGHGGLTTLGANVFSMGIAGPAVGLIIFYFLKRMNVSLGLRAFAAGFFADISTYTITSGQLALSLAPGAVFSTFIKFMLLFLPIQLPIAVLEGLVTSGIIKYIYLHRRDIITRLI